MSYTTALVHRSPANLSILDRTRAALRAFWRGPMSLKDPAFAKLFGSGYEAASGIHVTPENAFTFSAVFDAVLQISSDEAKLPLNVHKRRDDGGSDLYVDSPLYKLLKYEPNPEMGPMVFRRTIMAHALTCHGGYAEIERDTLNRPVALWPLTPDRVEPYREPLRTGRNGKIEYGPLVYKIDDGDEILPDRDVLHIHGLGYDGYTSYSVIDKARQTIGLALAAEKFGATFFGKGTMFGGWLESEDDLDEDQKAEIKSNIEKFRAAQDAAFRILVTGAGHKFHQFESKPSESQMDESRIRQVEEVARFFRMPPYKLGVNTPGTVSYASVEAANLDYYTGCLLDWITLVEQEFNRKLIPRLERGLQFIKHNVNAFLRADTAARSAFYQAMLDRGVFNADMVLELEDQNPQPNGQGKLLLVQGAMIPKDKLVEKIDADIAKTKRDPVQAQPQPKEPAVPGSDDRDGVIAELRLLLAQTDAELHTARDHARDLAANEVATAAERDAARHTILQLEAQSATQKARIETAMAERQAEADARLAAMDTAATETAARLDAERIAQEARALVEAAEANVATATQARDEAEDRAAAAQERADEAAALVDRIQQAQTRDHEAVQAAEDACAVALARAVAMEEARDRVVETLDTARAEVDRVARESADQLAHAAQRVDEATQQATKARAQLEALQGHRHQLEQDHAALMADADAQRRTVQTLTAALDATHARDKAHRIATIAAHRALIVDAFGRMTRREAQYARSKQATPTKLKHWLDRFASLETSACTQDLLPAVRTHLVWLRSADDAVARTTELVQAHLAEFERQLRDVLAADPEDFHADLERVLERWETDRAEQVADQLMTEEIRHVAD